MGINEAKVPKAYILYYIDVDTFVLNEHKT